MADHDGNHQCLVEKNVPVALILPSRWQDGAESLGIEHKLFMNKCPLSWYFVNATAYHKGRCKPSSTSTKSSMFYPENTLSIYLSIYLRRGPDAGRGESDSAAESAALADTGKPRAQNFFGYKGLFRLQRFCCD